MNCENIEISRHALKKALDRGLNLADAIEVVKRGEVIMKYTDTKPHPCFLLLGFTNEEPLASRCSGEGRSDRRMLVGDGVCSRPSRLE